MIDSTSGAWPRRFVSVEHAPSRVRSPDADATRISTSSCFVSFRPRNSRIAPTGHPALSRRVRFAVFIVYWLMLAP